MKKIICVLFSIISAFTFAIALPACNSNVPPDTEQGSTSDPDNTPSQTPDDNEDNVSPGENTEEEPADDPHLAFALSDDGKTYTVTGIGNVTDTAVIIPATYNNLPVTTINAGAFKGCPLKTITIDINIVFIGQDAFESCTELEGVYYNGTIESWCAIVFSNEWANPLSTGHRLYIDGEVVLQIIIPDSVTVILPYAFAGITADTILINAYVTAIGDGALDRSTITVLFGGTAEQWAEIETGQDNDILLTITIHAHSLRWSITKEPTCTEEGEMTLSCHTCGYAETKSIAASGHIYVNGICTVCDHVNPYYTEPAPTEGLTFELSDDGTYYIVKDMGQSEETDIVVPSVYEGLPVKEIASKAFANCTTITSVVVPDSVIKIGSDVFDRCSSLVSLTLPFVGESKKTSQDEYQYPLGYLFGDMRFDGSIRVEQYYYRLSTAFASSSTYYLPSTLKEVTITGGEILRGAFYDCSQIATITLCEGVTGINDCAFYNCASLKGINFPSSVTYIGANSFYNCALTNINIGDTIKAIESGAFSMCHELVSVSIGSGVTNIAEGAFAKCSSLESIAVSSDNDNYYVESNCLIDGNTKTVVRGFKGDCRIPDDGSIQRIGDDAFSFCIWMTEIELPEGIVSIGDRAFELCVYLKNVTLPNGLESIGNKAFSTCSAFTNVTIPDSVKTIGNDAYKGCVHILTLTIGSNVTSIGKDAFDGCSELKFAQFKSPDGWQKATTLTSTWLDVTGLSSPETAASAIRINGGCYWRRS